VLQRCFSFADASLDANGELSHLCPCLARSHHFALFCPAARAWKLKDRLAVCNRLGQARNHGHQCPPELGVVGGSGDHRGKLRGRRPPDRKRDDPVQQLGGRNVCGNIAAALGSGQRLDSGPVVRGTFQSFPVHQPQEVRILAMVVVHGQRIAGQIPCLDVRQWQGLSEPGHLTRQHGVEQLLLTPKFSYRRFLFTPARCAMRLTRAPAEPSDPYVALILRADASFARGDIDAAVAGLHPQLEWIEPEEFPNGGRHVGPVAVADYLGSSRSWWAELISEPTPYWRGDDIVIVHRAHGRLADGTPLDATVADVYTVRDDQVVRMQAYANPDEAFGAGS
jgi:ketosteroid isomerase-like protein